MSFQINEKIGVIKKLILPETSPVIKVNNRNVIFVHINKTGGTSIGKAIGLKKKETSNGEGNNFNDRQGAMG